MDLEALLTTNSSPPESDQTITGRRRIGELSPAGLPAFEVILDLFRPFLGLVPVMKVDLRIVFVLVLKFRDHRRWSESGCVRCTRRRLGRRVAARPAFSGEGVWPVGLYFLLRIRRCMLCMILAKLVNLYNCLSVRNRTCFILDFCVTVGWLPNLAYMLS